MTATLVEFVSGLVTKIRGPAYVAKMNREMHAHGAFPGHSWRAHVEALERFVPDLGQKTILDYGCGPLGGLRQHFGDRVIPFDPFVETFSRPPWAKPFDVVFSSDVFEHIPAGEIAPLLEKIRQSSAQYVFLNISTRRAHKPLPNGANAHLTIRSARWWLNTLTNGLAPQFTSTLAEADLLRDEGTFCFKRTDDRRTDGQMARISTSQESL